MFFFKFALKSLQEPKIRKWQSNQKTDKGDKEKNTSQGSSAGGTKDSFGSISHPLAEDVSFDNSDKNKSAADFPDLTADSICIDSGAGGDG